MTDPDCAPETARPAVPANALYRSHIEIGRILEAIARDECPLYTELGEDKLFVTRLLDVDHSAGALVFAYGSEKATNSMVLAAPSVEFVGNHHGAQIEFEVTGAAETVFDGEPAIRCAFPHALICSQRRAHSRIAVPADLALRCIADDAGVIPFEASIVDISLDGMACMLYDRGITLPAGTLLKGCRIMIPGRDAIVADLEVRYTTTVASPDGSLGCRAGVRFVRRPRGIEVLLDAFVHDLDRNTADL